MVSGGGVFFFGGGGEFGMAGLMHLHVLHTCTMSGINVITHLHVCLQGTWMYLVH